MKRAVLSPVVVSLALGCGGPQPASEPSAPPPAPPETAIAPPAAPSQPAAAPSPQPTAEEQKRAEDLKKLEADRQTMLAAHQAEQARLTPEIRAEAKKLSETGFASGRAAIQAALRGKHRRPGHPERDVHRHPVETLEFFGFKPGMTVVEYGPGEGWYTELLAPALAKKGKLLVTSADPNGPKDQRSTFYAERQKLFLERLPEAFGKVETMVVDSQAPNLPLEGSVDLVLVIRGLHGMQNSGTLDTWLSEFHQALKPNGVLGIVQHRAKPDTAVEVSSPKGYLPEPWVIQKIEAAGFKLAAKSEVNKNPKDTADHPEGVWALPPSYRNEAEREKYAAIGESDRMTLKFVKVASAKSATGNAPTSKTATGSAPTGSAAPGQAATGKAPTGTAGTGNTAPSTAASGAPATGAATGKTAPGQ